MRRSIRRHFVPALPVRSGERLIAETATDGGAAVRVFCHVAGLCPQDPAQNREKRLGNQVAPRNRMAGFHDVRDITAWQLAHQLNLRVDLFLLSPDFRRHYPRCDHLSVAVCSAPRHIAEGFARLGHQESAQLVRMARVFEGEVVNHLIDAHHQVLITDDELLLTRQLATRAMRAADPLIRFLESTSDAPMPAALTRRIPRRIPSTPTS